MTATELIAELRGRAYRAGQARMPEMAWILRDWANTVESLIQERDHWRAEAEAQRAGRVAGEIETAELREAN